MRYTVIGILDYKATEEVLQREAPTTLADIRAVLKKRLIRSAELTIRLEGEKTVVRVDCMTRKDLFQPPATSH